MKISIQNWWLSIFGIFIIFLNVVYLDHLLLKVYLLLIIHWEQSGVFLIEFLHSKFHSNLPVYIIKESKNALFLVICLSVIV